MRITPNIALRFVAYAVAVMFSMAVVGAVAAQEKSKEGGKRAFRAGAATSNITPALDQPVVGGFTPRPGKHIHDELHARCLVLDDGQTRIGFAICDNVGIPREVF